MLPSLLLLPALLIIAVVSHCVLVAATEEDVVIVAAPDASSSFVFYALNLIFSIASILSFCTILSVLADIDGKNKKSKAS